MSKDIVFEKLTLDIVRKHYISLKSGNNYFHPIYYYSEYEGNNPNNDNKLKKSKPDKIFTNIFIPNGNAMKSKIQNDFNDLEVYHLNKWLLTNSKQKNEEYMSLDGLTKFSGTTDGYLPYGMQICDGNYLSENCVNTTCWIQKLPVNKYPVNNKNAFKLAYINNKYNTYKQIITYS